MPEVYILDGNLKVIELVDDYTSLIWDKKYIEEGEFELYVQATKELMNAITTGKYIMRTDDDMVCEIKSIEIQTDVENGNYLIIKGVDVKEFLSRRIVWSQTNINGKVEDYIRDIVYKSLVYPNLNARQIKTTNGRANFFLAPSKGFGEVITQQVNYQSVSAKVQELCKKYGWGYRVYMQNENFYFDLYKGTDRTNYVKFSNDYENLISTTYVEDRTNIANVALVAGEGEGSKRSRNVSGYAESTNRYEIFVDAKEISRTISFEELTNMYPLSSSGGQGYIDLEGGGYVYKMGYINIPIVDANQLTELQINYPDGEIIYISGIQYYRAYDPIIADLKSQSPEDSDETILRDIVYSVYLLNKGYEELANYGITKSFEGSVEPEITFKYKTDYFLGDKVQIENDYGISLEARIVEVIEVYDENGYTIEPKFEYLYEEG